MINPIETIKTKIEDSIYSYEPNEFLPIRVNGEVQNWDAFAAYKAQRVAGHIGHGLMRTMQVTAHIAVAALEGSTA